MHNALSVTRRNQKYETRSPGVVPDFDRLHRDFDMEMTRVRSNMRRNITVPVEFKLNGVTPEDQHERDHKVRVGCGTGPCVGKVPLCQHPGFVWRSC